MDGFEPKLGARETGPVVTLAYLYDMIEQLASAARRSGENVLAIYLETAIAAHRATVEELSHPKR